MAAATDAQVGSLAGSVQRKQRTLSGMVWQRFTRHRMAVISLVVLLTLILASIIGPAVRPEQPETMGFRERSALKDLPPSLAHPMGTDSLGRDMLSRILSGGRISLSVGFLAITLAVGIGTLVGGLAGFYGGRLDNLLMRAVDLMLSLPRLFMLILMTVLLRSVNSPLLQILGGVPVIIFVIAVLAWMGTARIVRATFLSLKEKEFVEAARAAGASNGRIMIRHLLPNAMSPIIVAATLGLANAIIAESGLSFLGLGVQPPTPTWGNMLNTAQNEMLKGHIWMAIFPGLMIFITVICMNYIGDGLRDALDPYKSNN